MKRTIPPLTFWITPMVLAAVLSMSCTRDYVTGRPTFTVVSEASELRIGAEEDEKVVAMFGLYEDEKVSEFVDGLGQKIAEVSHRPELVYRFRVLDSPVLNAFALPGGYVYVTRGLMAHVGSTDELVGIISHEVGHVAGRHSAEQMSKQFVASGFGLLTALSRLAPRLGGLLSAPSALLMLSHSRRQEKESDKLGVEYTTRLGYDAREMSRFFTLLHAIAEKDGDRMPTFLSTHPDPGDRAENVLKLSNKWQNRLDWEEKPVESTPYLSVVDGLVFGENPRQGFAEEGVFYHPDLGFQFLYKEQWTLVNSRSSVILVSPREDALIQLTIEEGPSPKALAEQLVERIGLVVQEARAATVSGLDAYIVSSVTPRNDLRILSYFIDVGGMIYTFHAVTYPKMFDGYEADFSYTMEGFQRIEDPAILGTQPDRLRIRTVNSTTTLRGFLSSEGVSPEHHESIEQLNRKRLDDTVTKGDRVKIISK